MSKPYRIAAASGFWGDRNDALIDQVRGGPVDAVLLDYLAEVTMAILRKKLSEHPARGWATDFLRALSPVLDEVVAQGTKIVTNAGGMNPRACAEAVIALAKSRGHHGLRVGLVTGDDVFGRLDDLVARGASLANLDDARPFSTIRDRVVSANVYLGADPIARALGQGAQIVVTGRCTDSALALGPLIHRYGWASDDWNRRAAGIVAGHLLECGGQASGGNFAGGWQDVPDLARLGYPIAEVEASGDLVLTKHASLGGLITPAVVKEQLVYEISDPRAYVTPDVIADFTSVELEDLGSNRVRVFGVRGRPPPNELKASICHSDGWRNVVSMLFVWPHAVERARATERLLLERCRHVGIHIDAHEVSLVGVSGAHGALAPAPHTEPNEVLFSMAIRTTDADSARRFGHEISPLILDGMPGAGPGPGLGGRPDPQPIVNHWPALVPRDAVAPEAEVLVS